jgi:phosphohistidine phosphatase
MRVILFRHGIAVDRDDPACPPDPLRPLTAEGVDRTRRAARGLARLGVAPGRILSSPYLRALGTAEIAAGELGGAPVERCDDLIPSADPRRFLALLGAEDREVLVTGHEPHLSSLAALLVSGRPGAWLRLKKAGAVAIELDDTESGGEIVWLLTPRALRELGERR